MKILIELSGWIAAIISILIALPQIHKTFKLKEAEGVSKFSFTAFVIGMYLWSIYIMFTHSVPGAVVSIAFVGGFSIILFGILKFSGIKHYLFYGVILLINFIVITTASVWVIWRKEVINKDILFSLGIISGFITNTVFIPQVIETFKSKNVTDLSLMTFVLSAISYIFWTVYWVLLLITVPDYKTQLPALIFTITWLINMIVQSILILYYKKHRK